jgi:hypothetical protein
VSFRRDSIHHWNPHIDLIDSLHKRMRQNPQRQFAVVLGPYHRSYYESFVQKDFQSAQEVLNRLDTVPNCTVIKIEGRDWPDAEFLNTSHVSLSGAKRFSQTVRDSLRIHGLLAPQNPVSSRQ